MNYFVPLLMIATGGHAHTRMVSDAKAVYQCSFEHHHDAKRDADVNYDGWPDGWKRRRGKGFPQYVGIGIRGIGQRHHLQVDLDGGAASITSPPVKVSSMSGYVLDARVRTEGLKHNDAFVELLFQDMNGQTIQRYTSRRFSGTSNWRRVRLGPVNFSDSRIHQAVIGLNVVPRDRKTDLRGRAMFDDIWLAKLPRVTLTCNGNLNLITDPKTAVITCTISGCTTFNRDLKFQLLDVHDRVVAQQRFELQPTKVMNPKGAGKRSPQETKPSGPPANSMDKSKSDDDACLNKTIHWRPKLDFGYYRARVLLEGRADRPLERVLPICVVRKQKSVAGGEFGWAIPDGNRRLTTKRLVPLLALAGISRVKFPVWHEGEATNWTEQLAQFAADLEKQNVRMIGILDQPPADMRNKFDTTNERVPIASIFLDKGLWAPMVDPVMTRLSLKINQWQLGRDDDNSFAGFPNLEQKLAEIKAHLNRFGQEIDMGLSWSWLHQPPQPTKAKPSSWQFLSLRVDPPFTPHELRHHLETSKQRGVKQWVTVRPLDRRQYSLQQRVVDLVQRLIAAQRGRADGVFISDPFHPDHGLLTENGLPNELFLPWRTAALALGGTKYVGSIQMPQGSENHIFERNGDAVMILWNSRPVKEVLYLGHKIHIEDVWGKTVPTVERRVDRGKWVQQVIPVGRTPVFVHGVSPSIAKWRMSFNFPRDQLDSIFGREQTVPYRFSNGFDQGVGGSILVQTPWDDTDNSQRNFKIAAGDTNENNFQVTLKSNTTSGVQPVRVIFEVTADRKYRFAAFRNLVVGSRDVTVDLVTSLNEQGDLVVEQHITNLTDQFISFTCTVFVDGRKRQRKRVVNLARGRITLPFVFPDGEELLGEKVSIRTEEINGDRILNYHTIAER